MTLTEDGKFVFASGLDETGTHVFSDVTETGTRAFDASTGYKGVMAAGQVSSNQFIVGQS